MGWNGLLNVGIVWIQTVFPNADPLLPDVEVPGVVLVVGDVDPVVVGDDPLVEAQDGLVTSLQASQNTIHISSPYWGKEVEIRQVSVLSVLKIHFSPSHLDPSDLEVPEPGDGAGEHGLSPLHPRHVVHPAEKLGLKVLAETSW